MDLVLGKVIPFRKRAILKITSAQTGERLILFILATFQFNHILDFVIMMPLGPQFTEVFKISTSQFGLLVSAYTWSAGIFSFVASFFIDRFDRKSALLIAFTGFTLGTFFCAASPTYIMLLISRIFAGAFGGILGALVFTVIGDIIPVERRGKATATVMSAFSVASVLGIPGGVFLANAFGWRMPFFVLSLGSLGVLIFAWKCLPSMNKHVGSQTNTGKGKFIVEMIREKNQLFALFLLVMLQMAGFLVIPFITQYMIFNVGLEKTDLPYIYLFGGGISFFTCKAVGKMSDSLGSRKVFVCAAFLSIIPVFIITHLPHLSLSLVLVVTTFFFVFNGARFIPAMTLLTSCVEAKNRGRFLSITSSFKQLISGAASFVGGIIVYQDKSNGQLVNFDTLGFMAITATLVCIVCVSFIKNPSR